jgi:HPt (histidine-containing phosphotransfer) domain-containing protein
MRLMGDMISGLVIANSLEGSLGADAAALLTEMIEDYLAEGALQVAEIQAATETGGADRVRRAAHSLRSSSQLFGALELVSSCKALEMDLRDGRLEGLAERAVKIDRDFAAAKAALLHRIKLAGSPV